MLDFVARFKEKLHYLKVNSDQSHFQACNNISSDMIRTSEFIEYPEGIFIGEFFESLFNNLVGVVDNFSIKENEIRPIQNNIGELIELFETSLSSGDSNLKSTIYDKIVTVRFLVTEFQVKSFREGTRKRGRRVEQYPRISIEGE